MDTGRGSIILSYDFSDSSADIAQLETKYDRDGITGELLILCFGANERTHSAGRITVVSKRARLGRLRPFYDLLFIYFAPRIVREKQFRPQEIIIADFALAWAAHMVKRAYGGKVVLRLSGLLSEVARTRSVFHFFYGVNPRIPSNKPEIYELIECRLKCGSLRFCLWVFF